MQTEKSKSIKTLIQVSLLPVAKEDETERVLAPEEWTGLPAIKERPSFQFGRLNNPTMDLMMLQVEQSQNVDGRDPISRAGCCVGGGHATNIFSLRCG